MTTIKLKVPEWVKEDFGEKAITKMLASESFVKMEYYRTRSAAFEKKYKTGFESFSKKVKSSAKEDFKKWDDYIEWDANRAAYLEWKKKHEELLECSR